MSNGQELARRCRRVVKVYVVVEPVRRALIVYVITPTKATHFTLHDGGRLVRTIISYEAKVYFDVLVDSSIVVFMASIVDVS